MTTGETFSEMVERVCGRTLDQLASTEDLRGFAGAREAMELSPLRRIACKLAGEEMEQRRKDV